MTINCSAATARLLAARRGFGGIVIALVLAICPADAGIINGSFEAPAIGNATFSNIVGGAEPSGFAWTVVTNNVDIFSVGVLGTTGLVVDGNQALDLVGFGTTGAIEQTFNTILGQTYTLTFHYGNNTGSGPSSALVTVKDGETALLSQTISHATSIPSNYDWTFFSANFTATGATASLRFTNTVGSNNGGILLDNISVDPFNESSIPEPSAMWLAAAGLTGLAAVKEWRNQRRP